MLSITVVNIHVTTTLIVKLDFGGFHQCLCQNSVKNCRNVEIDQSLTDSMKSFRMDYFDCCWPAITNDDLEVNSRPSFYLTSFFYNLQNASPEVKVPAVWTVTKGCDEQKLNLNPYDADGNAVKCRWASGVKECGDGCWNEKLSSLQLDENTCTITYSGTFQNYNFIQQKSDASLFMSSILLIVPV